MQKYSSRFRILFFCLVIFLSGGLMAHYFNFYGRLAKPVLAEDNESEQESDEGGSSTSSTKVEYKTIYTKLPDTVVTTTKQIPRYDSDGDGLYDDTDPHPAINEFFIVPDKNLNGIDDRYEQL